MTGTISDLATSRMGASLINPFTTEVKESLELTFTTLPLATPDNVDDLLMTDGVEYGSGVDSTTDGIAPESTSDLIDMSTLLTINTRTLSRTLSSTAILPTPQQDRSSNVTSLLIIPSTSTMPSQQITLTKLDSSSFIYSSPYQTNRPPGPGTTANEVDLFLVFTAVAVFMVLLIGLAFVLLVCLCCGQRNTRKGRNVFKQGVRVEELPMNKNSRPKYSVINKPHPPMVPQHTVDSEMLVFENMVDGVDENEPQELLAFESLRPLPPPPAEVTPRSSVRMSAAGASRVDDYSYLEEVSTIYSDYKEPADTIGKLAPTPVSIDPYDDVDGGDKEATPHRVPPPVPPRESPQVSTSSELSNSPDYDHIYRESLEPSMLDKPALPPKGEQEALPYAPIYIISKSKTPRAFQISMHNIRLIQKLGKGHFGKVYLAATSGVSLSDLKLSSDTNRHRSLLVAVKQLKAHPGRDLIEAFYKQISFMSRLKHANVIRLLATSTGENPFIVMEYMENGDLYEFLRQQQLKPDGISAIGPNEVTPMILFYISVQIASGMHYLASKKFIHRDLATRNCLIGRDFVVKISDFGMSKNVYKSSYYLTGQLILPIRWMATETFYGKFSVKSDAWAYGVTVWEVFTLCQDVPYSNMSDNEVIQDALKGEGREVLGRPEACLQEVYEVMKRCFIFHPFMRADFEEIYSRMLTVYTAMSQQNT